MARRRRRSGEPFEEPPYEEGAYDVPAFEDDPYAAPVDPAAVDAEGFLAYEDDSIERWASEPERHPAGPVQRRPTAGGSILRAVASAAVVFGVYAGVTSLQGEDPDIVLQTEAEPTLPPIETAPDVPAPGAPTDVATAPLEPLGTPTAAFDDGPPATETSVQVLAGADDARYRAAIAALEALGYEVTESGPAANQRDQTTVFATTGHEAEAEALIQRDPRFGVIDDNPGLTAAIDIHVVVGADWPLDGAGTGATDAATDG